MNESNNHLRFNLTFLEDESIKQCMIDKWNEEPRPIHGGQRWDLWVARAIDRIHDFYWQEGKNQAQARRERLTQLKATLESAERLL